MWRKRSDISDEYIKSANKVQSTYRISAESFDTSAIIEGETFAAIEEKLIECCLNEEIKDLSQIQEVVIKRKSLFWASKMAEYSLIWLIIGYCVNLRLHIKMALKDIKRQTLSLSDIVKYYIGANNSGWYLVDKFYRLMELKYADFDIGNTFDDKLERFIIKSREEYSKFLSIQVDYALSSMQSGKMLAIDTIMRQKNIFRNKVLPVLREKGKCAYFMVDSLRYEMGEELFHSVEECEKKEIFCALTNLPTTTPFGMLALSLSSDESIYIQTTGKKLGLKAGDIKVSNRNERIKYISHNSQFYTDTFKLEEVIKPRKAVREKVKKADLLIITSQEIDSLCESGQGLLARQVMNNIFLQMKRAIYHLAELGVESFVVTADHGFLLGSEMGKDSKVDVPKGKTFDLHKRVWIGIGGDNPQNTIRFKASDFGYKSDLDFVFPRTLAVFKTPGGDNEYFHGGISLQEMVVPVVDIKMKPSPKKKYPAKEEYYITLSKDTITNRIFTVTIMYKVEKLLIPEVLDNRKMVRVKIFENKEEIGRAETSEYGFEEATKEIVLEQNKKNVVTIILNDDIMEGSVTICLIDSITELELAKVDDIPLKITI
ncbi:MAG: PglZ domain protein [Candidatus Scalindua rubra]|uniref:PglZ domain protein n=1 Tax=Candidatus Scalindua rubra TaxID=1872076 RepID=A0A1E3X6I4_9BACT|nr:MAG: PglZ domain protein [Candidatus Scalindua rubra]